jgi:hypothetical protein
MHENLGIDFSQAKTLCLLDHDSSASKQVLLNRRPPLHFHKDVWGEEDLDLQMLYTSL